MLSEASNRTTCMRTLSALAEQSPGVPERSPKSFHSNVRVRKGGTLPTRTPRKEVPFASRSSQKGAMKELGAALLEGEAFDDRSPPMGSPKIGRASCRERE